MILDFLIQPVTGIVSDVLKRVLPPEKVSEADRLKAEQEVTLQLLKMDTSRFEKEIEDRASARALAAAEGAKGNAWTMALAAVNRPAWSLVCLGLFAYTLIGQSLGGPRVELTPAHESIMQTVIIFYFGLRGGEKMVGMIANRKK